MCISLGKSGSSGTTVQTPEMTPEQRTQIQAQNELFTGTIAPTYRQTVGSATDLYNLNAPGVTNAAQNLAGTAGKAQQVLGSTGESALRTGISGLESLFSNDYEQNQIRNALLPAQQQYMQNLAGQQAQFGGAGSLGSARSALAQTALAGQTQAAQQKAATDIQAQIAGQRLSAGQSLAGLGQGGIGQAIGAAGQGVSAANAGQDFFNKYASVIYGVPSVSYNPDYRGTQGSTTNTSGSGYQMGVGGAYGSSPIRF